MGDQEAHNRLTMKEALRKGLVASGRTHSHDEDIERTTWGWKTECMDRTNKVRTGCLRPRNPDPDPTRVETQRWG